MPLEERVSFEDMFLYEILRNPVTCGEFIYNYDKRDRDEEFKFTPYQREMLSDFAPYQVYCTARATGKTVSMTSLILWLMVFSVFPKDSIMFATPSKIHLLPVWDNLVKYFRSNSFLKNFIAPNTGINSSDYTIKLLNFCTIDCRIAGQSGTGQNFAGAHVPLQFAEEAGYFPWSAFQEMQPCLNTFTPGYREVVAGVPIGVREKNILYFADQVSSTYSKHRVSALDNPRFSEKDHAQAIEQYGGSDSDDYIHYVLGQHGKPVFALFDRGNFAFGDDPVYKLTLNGTQIGEMLSEYLTKIDIFPSLPSKEDTAILCVDLGYTEPTAIIILYQDRLGRLRFHGRIEMTKVSYPIQEKLLNVLDSKFHPALIGIDKGAGGQGISVVQHMLEDIEYAHKDYQKRLVPVDFSTSMVIGIDSDGNEIKSKTKPFATSVLQEYANNHKIMFSHKDLEMVNELERMTYSRTPTGEIVYKTLTQKGGKSGSDHFTAALLCGIMAYYIKNDFMLYKSERKVLARPSWV
jgi:hypothetical protein